METNETSHNSASNFFKAIVTPILVNELVCIDLSIKESLHSSLIEVLVITSFIQAIATLCGCLAGFILLIIIKALFFKQDSFPGLLHKLLPISLLVGPVPLLMLLFNAHGGDHEFGSDEFHGYFLFCAWSASIITTWYFARSYAHENDI